MERHKDWVNEAEAMLRAMVKEQSDEITRLRHQVWELERQLQERPLASVRPFPRKAE